MKAKTILAEILILSVLCGLSLADELLVPDEYLTIQAAIDAAVDGDVIRVADGTYTGTGNKNLDFGGRVITVRSENGPKFTTIDCQNDGRGFYFQTGEDQNSIVAGFNIINGSTDYGAGIRCDISSPTINNCIFKNNTATILGGGIYAGSSSPVVTNCTFEENRAGEHAGGICCTHSEAFVSGCIFIGNYCYNSSGDGGAMWNAGDTSATIINCLFVGNTTAEAGGAIRNDSSSPTIINCTFAENSAPIGGAMHNAPNASPIITNCIFWGNYGDEIDNNGDCHPTISYCDIEGGWNGPKVDNRSGSSVIDGGGNIDAEPLFIDAIYPDLYARDYHLSNASPCIDAARDAGVDTDIEGKIRPIDFPYVDNNGELPEFDIGAYEAIPPKKAFAPYPPHSTMGIDPNVVLSWSPGQNALSHDVYFGTSYDDVNNADTLSDEYKGNYNINSYDPCGLDLETTYYWRIDEVNEPNIVKGDLWSFTTGSLPGQASNPSPADLATAVSTDAYLTWTAGSDATSHDVYFGTSSTPPFVTNQTTTTFAPPTMDFSTTYYWCIDEINKLGKNPGQVWSFTTRDVSYWELWTEPMPVTEVNTEYADWTPFLSFDGLSLYFARGRTSGYYYFRIFEATRQKPYGPFTSVNEVLSSSGQHLFGPWVSPDNLRMYYFAQKESPILWQLKVSERASVNDPWPLGSNISELNILGKPHVPKLTADELIIFFASPDIPGEGGYDIWMATRPDMNSPFDEVTNLAEINTTANEVCPSVSPDGLTLLFQSNHNGDWQFFKATRQSLTEPFGDIELLPILEIPGYTNHHPCLNSDGSALYFTRLLGTDLSTGDIYVSYLIDPNKASAPSPADGATYVDPNVVLSWAPGEDALSHNVYFGTSFDDVNDANTLSEEYKGNFDVNSFDPCDLDPGTTYYWRIDEVSDSNNTSKGYVWDFTTEAFFIMDPVSWWMFDEGLGVTAHDSANDNDGTIYGATWTTGQIDGALSFDGFNDYVDMADTVKNYLDTSYSVSAWIKANTISLNKAILSYRHSTDANPVLFALGQYYTNVDFAVRDNSHNLAQPSFVDAITANTWYHVAGVREANTVNVYVNGVSGTPVSETLGAITPDNLKIGADQWGGNPVSDHFNGAIDDVMIFDRALSEEEIWELYQSAFCEPGYPCINLLPESLEFFADEGGPDPAPQILSITNFGADTLNYQISEDCPWLQVDPNAGSSAGEPTEVTVTVDISGLDCGIYDCNLIISDPNASNTPRIVPVELEVYRQDCHIDVRVAPVAVLIDPDETSKIRTTLPDSIAGVVRGSSYYIEIWASDLGKTNTGLTGVYVDVGFCSQTGASELNHGTIFVTFPNGTIQPGGVDEFGGSALPSGGGIEPEWVRVGWIHMDTQTETGTCTISLLPSSFGIAALDRGAIPWTAVDLGSVELEIAPPVRSYDLDGDDFIGLSDLSFFAGSWKQHVPPGDEEHDFDCDNKVGISDLSWFATGWQKYTNDPTILYPPCTAGGQAAWLPNNSALEMQSSDVSQTSIPADIDIAFNLAVLDSPSSSDTTSTLPTSVKKISAGQTYYLELWVRDSGHINTGLTSAYIDLSFPTDAATVTNVSYGSIFTLFNEESVLSGKIDELGGSSLPGGDGVEPEWARVAVVQILADATLPFVTFTLSPSSLGVAALGRGTIPWDDISLTSLLICPANFNSDAVVDEKDLAIFASAWHTQPGDPQWNPNCDITTPTGYIDRSDLGWVVDSWLIGIAP